MKSQLLLRLQGDDRRLGWHHRLLHLQLLLVRLPRHLQEEQFLVLLPSPGARARSSNPRQHWPPLLLLRLLIGRLFLLPVRRGPKKTGDYKAKLLRQETGGLSFTQCDARTAFLNVLLVHSGFLQDQSHTFTVVDLLGPADSSPCTVANKKTCRHIANLFFHKILLGRLPLRHTQPKTMLLRAQVGSGEGSSGFTFIRVTHFLS